MDGYAEQLLIEKFITLDEAGTIGYEIIKKLGKDNPRLTEFKLYFQDYKDYQIMIIMVDNTLIII